MASVWWGVTSRRIEWFVHIRIGWSSWQQVEGVWSSGMTSASHLRLQLSSWTSRRSRVQIPTRPTFYATYPFPTNEREQEFSHLFGRKLGKLMHDTTLNILISVSSTRYTTKSDYHDRRSSESHEMATSRDDTHQMRVHPHVHECRRKVRHYDHDHPIQHRTIPVGLHH